jgi:oligoribonuclease NrnB/cAMP/cGMP phosphodiesterase (DHH superfamily)
MKIFCFVHHDLDGLVSLLAIKWFFPKSDIQYQSTTAMKFREDFLKWTLKNNIESYDKIFILDLDVGEHVELIDKANFIIIDHHNTHVENSPYDTAAVYIENTTSTAMLIYRTFTKQLKLVFTVPQKTLILLADDYDSYIHQIDQSKILNAVFWNTQNNFETLLNLYKNGFIPFTEQQLNIYNLHIKAVELTIKNLIFFENNSIKINDNFYHIIATFATKHINNIADYILDNYKPDIAIIVNTNTKHISFRRGTDTNIDLGVFSQSIANGGGHPYAAGGIITDDFMTFTKKLKPKKRLRKKNE